MPVDADGPNEHRRLFVDGFTPAQKATTIAVVVALVIAGVAFAKWSAEPSAPVEHGAAGGTTSRASSSVAAGASSSQLAQTQAYDAALEQRIEDMVSRTLGPGMNRFWNSRRCSVGRSASTAIRPASP